MKKFWPLTNYSVGHFAEKWALLFLILKGYWPVKINYVVGRGTGASEVDLIVKKHKTLVFVEVKKRPSEDQAKEAVQFKNQKRIERSSRIFLAHYPQYQNYEIRYDVLWIKSFFTLKHLKNAWRPWVLILCIFLSGCRFGLGLVNAGYSVGVVVADDQPFSEDIQDILLYTKIRQKLASLEIKTLLDVQVTVFGKHVLLTGALSSMDLITSCVKTVWQLDQVQYVYNYIRLGNSLGFVDSIQESYYATSVKNRLLLTEGIKSSNYKIVLENGVMYVMGLKQNQEEWEKAKNVIKQVDGIDEIIYLMQDL